MVGLLFGAVAGYASAFGPCRAAREDRRAAFEAHIADVCVAAAERKAERAAPGATPRAEAP